MDITQPQNRESVLNGVLSGLLELLTSGSAEYSCDDKLRASAELREWWKEIPSGAPADTPPEPKKDAWGISSQPGDNESKDDGIPF